MRKLNATQHIGLLERLELYIDAGFAIDAALVLASKGFSGTRAEAVAQVGHMVRSGQPLGQSMRSALGLSEASSNIIGQGESSNGLVPALSTARAMLERQDSLRKECLSALAYPLVIFVAACCLALGLVRGVMPQIFPMLESLHVQLPFLTRAVMAISEFIGRYGIYVLVLSATVLFGAPFAYRRSRLLRVAMHHSIYNVPLLGSLLGSYAMSAFMRSCGSLISAGASSVESFSVASSAISFTPVRQKLLREAPRLRRGEPFGDALARAGFSAASVGLVAAGEVSANLGGSLMRSADIEDKGLSHRIKRLTSLIEPAMMIVMGGAVGAIALSIMMPIYEISKAIQK